MNTIQRVFHVSLINQLIQISIEYYIIYYSDVEYINGLFA